MAGEDSKLALVGKKLHDWKNEILMKILELKMSRIGIIAEFRGILTKFPKQGYRCPKK